MKGNGFHVCLFLIYLKGRVRETDRYSICWFTCQMPRLEQARARRLEFHLGLPLWWKGLKYLNHHLLPRQNALVEAGLEAE